MTTFSRITEIEEQIKKQKAELEQLEKHLEAAKMESPDHLLAKELHGMLCGWNHTDGCSWFYEKKDGVDDWTGYAHGTYLKKAQTLIRTCEEQGCTVDHAISMYKLIKGI